MSGAAKTGGKAYLGPPPLPPLPRLGGLWRGAGADMAPKVSKFTLSSPAPYDAVDDVALGKPFAGRG